MYEQAKIFYANIAADKNHRYKSWEHCFNYFLQSNEDIEVDKACLHLSFYLASWGMYRGSSYLLQKDYLIHEKLIKEIILNEKYKRLQAWNFIDNNEQNIKILFELNKKIKEYYKKEITKVNGEKKEVKVSDILSTKIILGTFGCVPAYDRFFISGLKSKNKTLGLTFNQKNFANLIKIYEANRENIDRFSCEHSFYKHNYPIMKIIDMYFWQLGFELS